MAHASAPAGASPAQPESFVSTLAPSSPVYDGPLGDFDNIPIVVNIAVSAARAELIFILGLLCLVVALRTRRTIVRACRAAHRPVNSWLLVHIAISFFEVGRLQYKALPGTPVHPTAFDLALGLGHCLSGYQLLLRRTRAGYKDLIPLGLRLQPLFFRIVATIVAFVGSSPSIHRANIRLGFDSFLYARLLIYACTKLSPFAFGPRTLHTSTAVLGGFIATYDSGFRYGSLVYIVFSIISIALDSRTAKFMASLSDTREVVEHRATTAALVRKDVPSQLRTFSRGFLRPIVETRQLPYTKMLALLRPDPRIRSVSY